MKPLVSIVIPVWNQEKYVAEAIESVLTQTYPNLELIVVDDGSTDKTPDIVKGYGDRLTYIRQKNKGAATALNVGTRKAKGELVGWLSSDDVYFKNKIGEQVKYFENYPQVSLVYTDFQMIDGQGKITQVVKSPYYQDRKEFIKQMILGNFVNGSSILAKKRELLKAGLFDPKMKYHADGDMWFRILKNGDFGHVDKVLLKYRWHAGNASHDTPGMKEYLYIYFDKIRDLFGPTDLFGGSNEKYHKFFATALQKNGLHGPAFYHICHGGGGLKESLSLGVSFASSVVRSFLRKDRK